MLGVIGELWHSGFWNKVYVLLGVVVIVGTIITIAKNYQRNPNKVLTFIESAQKNKCIAAAKLSCLSLHGVGRPFDIHAEYVYYVNDKRYFVTYEIMVESIKEDDMEEVNADILVDTIKPTLILFYDEKNPKKVYTKMEAFTSNMALKKIKTPKKNMWRSFDSTWESPIDLVKYN